MKLFNFKRKYMRTALIAAVISAFTLTVYCSQSNDDNDDELIALAFLASQGSGKEQSKQALAVNSVVSTEINEATQGGDLAILVQDINPEKMLASVNSPKLILTALSNSSGSCTGTFPSVTCDVVITGSASCTNGGTVTFNSVTYKATYTGTSSSSFQFDGTINGPITFSNCSSTYTDVFTGKSESATLNGGVTVSTNGTSNFSVSGSVSTVGSKSTNSFVSDGLTVNGNAVSWSEGTSEQDYTMTIETLSSNPLTIKSTRDGTLKWNGSTVASFNNEVTTIRCTGSTIEDLQCTEI